MVFIAGMSMTAFFIAMFLGMPWVMLLTASIFVLAVLS